MPTFGHHSEADASAALAPIVSEDRSGTSILQALTQAIVAAHSIGPKMWAISLLDRKVRLNFGPVEVFLVFADDHAWFPALLPKRFSVGNAEREPAPHKWLQPADLVFGSHEAVARAFRDIAPRFTEVLEHVRRQFKSDKYINAGARKAHARGLLMHLERRLGLTLPRPGWDVPVPDVPMPAVEEASEADHFDPSLAEIVGVEGDRRLRVHYRAERDREIVDAAKELWRARDPALCCVVCGFSAELTYGGRPYVEAHHIVPLSKIDGVTETRIEDLACVCANCHRALHSNENLTIETLRDRVTSARRSAGSAFAASGEEAHRPRGEPRVRS